MRNESDQTDAADRDDQRWPLWVRRKLEAELRIATSRSRAVIETVLVAVGLLAVVWWVGRAMALGGGGQTFALGLSVVLLVAPLARVAAGRLGSGVLAVEVPIVLLVFSTLVFRVRTSNDLAFNPLDPAAQLRVVSAAVALLLGALAFMGRDVDAPRAPGPRTTLPFRLYCLYTLVAWIGAPNSVDFLLTAYRGVELLAGILVIAGAYRSVGRDAGRRIANTLYWCTVVLVGTVWMGVLLFPDRALARLLDRSSPVRTDLEGVYPRFAANGVGTLGVVLAFWSLARLWSPAGQSRPPRPVTFALAVLGTVTLIFSQYRTGYIALMLAVAVLLVVQKRKVLATVLVAVALTVVYWAPSLVTDARPYVLRGQTTTQARQLSGRVNWWSNAIPVWRESPLIGRGLLTASRFEVLAPLGNTTTAGLHSTWVESLVGTGVLGVSLLAGAFLVALKRAVTAARRHSVLAPVLLLAILGTRSLTGNTFESFSYEALIFMTISMSLSLPREWPDLEVTIPSSDVSNGSGRRQLALDTSERRSVRG